MELTELTGLFENQFKTAPRVFAEAPGRVNLLGEHTDYNDGFVFPAAIDRSMRILASPRDDRTVRVYSADFSRAAEFNLGEINKSEDESWSNYLRGVADQLLKNGYEIRGGDFLISGNVPVGAGLSSSAAYEVAASAAFREMCRLEIDNVKLALLSQAAERQFVGVQCGIMDQFVSANARESTALFLDCRDLTYRNIPLVEGVSIVVCDSDVQRALNNSAYNDRRNECEEAASRLKEVLPDVRALRDVSLPDLEKNRSLLNEAQYQRASHVISENERVLAGIEHLEKGDIEAFGTLLYESHNSLRDAFEVSCPELDLLVDLAGRQPGIIGSRMTGAGFGGCTVSLVESSQVEKFRDAVKSEYDRLTGKNSRIYACRPSAGVASRVL